LFVYFLPFLEKLLRLNNRRNASGSLYIMSLAIIQNGASCRKKKIENE
jgi:hypothetical protein